MGGASVSPCLPQCPRPCPACPIQRSPSPRYRFLQQPPTLQTAPAPPRGSGMRTCRAQSRQGTQPHTTVRTPCWRGSCPQPPPMAPLCLTGSSLQAGRLHPAPRRRTPTPLRAATTMTSRALAAEDGDGQHRAVGRGLRALWRTRGHAVYISLGLLRLPPPCWGTGRGAGAPGGMLGAGCARLRASIKSFSQLVTVSLGHGDGCSAAPQ